MHYQNTTTAVFLSRPNRFLAHAMVDGKEVVCHVKNTGRLRELLIPGTRVVLEHHPNAAASGRKTEYSLIGVETPTPSGNIWVNIDSQAPNTVAWEWLSGGQGLPFRPRPQKIRREVLYDASRFDLAFSDCGIPWFMEVKGVTLERDGVALFPDAPTERGVKHLQELIKAVKDGYQAAVLFVIQRKGVSSFAPNAATHPEFAAALALASKNGVHVWAYDCLVSEDSLHIDRPIDVLLP